MKFLAAASVSVALLATTTWAGHLRVETDESSCGLEPPTGLPLPPVPSKGPTGVRQFTTPVVRQEAPLASRDATGRFFTDERSAGILTGKTVYLSPGHGFVWEGGGWNTQRGNTHGLVEDLVSAEAMDQYVAEYLRRMGAYVVTVRESDPNPAMVIVDDTGATATGVTFAAGSDSGYGGLPGPTVSDETNPFATGTARRLTTHPAATGELTYEMQVPESGYYVVYVSYHQAAGNAPDAHYLVRHAGGTSSFRVDQRRHGTTWVRLGRFYFDHDGDHQVAVLDDSATPGSVVSVDAVRLGGGMSPVDRGEGVSGRPMWEMAAHYYAQLAGAPTSVWNIYTDDHSADVATRSRFSAWDHEAGEDAVYMAWHTNATGTSEQGHGTETYTYSPNPPPASLSAFSGTAGSRQLQDALHAELVGDLRKDIDPDWVDRGRFTAYFGEVNPNHNDEMPAVLVEVGFHDGVDDSTQIAKPEFRRVASRALAQGIAKYFAAKDGVTLTLPPEPPAAVTFVAGHLSWRPGAQDEAGGDPPTGYRVYLSSDGLGFDDGRAVSGTSFDVPDLVPGQAVYARVTATNAGGESLDSLTVGSRAGETPVLLVNGFSSLAPEQLIIDDLSDWRLGMVKRMWLWRINDLSYLARHGQAVAGAFDSASADAIAAGDLLLGGYRAIDWMVGRQAGPMLARAELADYMSQGGRLFISGAHLVSDLAAGEQADKDFLAQTLHAGSDGAGKLVVGGGSGIFAGLAVLDVADPSRESYEVLATDAVHGDSPVLTYDGDAGGSAAITWGGEDTEIRGVLLGFPFETIAGAEARTQVMERVLDFLEAGNEPPPPPPPPPGDDVTEDCGCRVGGQGSTPPAWPLLLILGLSVGMLRRKK